MNGLEHWVLGSPAKKEKRMYGDDNLEADLLETPRTATRSKLENHGREWSISISWTEARCPAMKAQRTPHLNLHLNLEVSINKRGIPL